MNGEVLVRSFDWLKLADTDLLLDALLFARILDLRPLISDLRPLPSFLVCPTRGTAENTSRAGIAADAGAKVPLPSPA